MKKNKQKSKRVQIQDVHGKLVNIHMPKGTTETQKRIFKTYAQRLVSAERNGHERSREVDEWLGKQSKVIKSKLQRLGIRIGSDNDESCYQIYHLTQELIKSKRDTGSTNWGKYNRAAERLVGWSANKGISDIRDFTSEHAKKFSEYARSTYDLDPRSSLRRFHGYCSAFFKLAEEQKLIVGNPFKDLPKHVIHNKKNNYKIPKEETAAIFACLKIDDDKLRFVLMRYLGLRSPSEHNEVRWSDFDWTTNLVQIRSPKLKNSDDKYERLCAFNFPEAMETIRHCYENRPSDDAKILPAISHAALTRKVAGWLGKAGIEKWPHLLQNFRRTAVTEACEIWPSHVVAAFFGHSELISLKNYRMTTAEHTKRLDG
jgi:hypothetical protein